jgi:hypothetical protein
MKFTILKKLYSGVQNSGKRIAYKANAVYRIPYRNVKGVWWMPRLQKAMKDVVWLR